MLANIVNVTIASVAQLAIKLRNQKTILFSLNRIILVAFKTENITKRSSLLTYAYFKEIWQTIFTDILKKPLIWNIYVL